MKFSSRIYTLLTLILIMMNFHYIKEIISLSYKFLLSTIYISNSSTVTPSQVVSWWRGPKSRNRSNNNTFTVELAHYLSYVSSWWTSTMLTKRNTWVVECLTSRIVIGSRVIRQTISEGKFEEHSWAMEQLSFGLYERGGVMYRRKVNFSAELKF